MKKRQQFTMSRFAAMSPDEAKWLVRDAMVGMKVKEREEFIRSGRRVEGENI